MFTKGSDGRLKFTNETSRVNGLQGKVLDALLLDWGGGQGVILKLINIKS